MNELADIQARFQGAVFAGNLPSGPDGDDRLWLNGHFEIYVNAYRGRLAEVLADNFPVLYKALGDDAFASLAQAYIKAEPSTFRSARWFGHRLVEFMDSTPALLPHPALADIARMDWAIRGAFDSADKQVLTVEDIANIPGEKWSGLQFMLHPSARLIDLHWQVELAWHALSGEQEIETEPPQALMHTLLV